MIGAITLPLPRVQQLNSMPVIAYLSGGSPSFYTTILRSSAIGLGDNGYLRANSSRSDGDRPALAPAGARR
jgi:hypothetical protein